MKHEINRLDGRFAGALTLLLVVLLPGLIAPVARAQTVSPFNLPLYFEASQDRTEFLSRGNDCEILISAGGAQIALRNGANQPATARMSFVGGNSRAATGGDGELPGKINYLIGSDSSKWQTGLPTFSRVRVSEIYPGINLVFHGNQRQLEYDFNLESGANPSAIKMRFDGMDNISITPDGDLVLKIGAGEIRQPKPEIYQAVAGGHKVINGGYKILDARTVAFDIGRYDRSLPLVIDPLLSFSSYFAGNPGTTAWAIARDNANDFTFIAGQTFSKQFFTKGAFQTNFAGGDLAGDAFVAKFGDPATNLIYLTYLGGNSDDAAFAIAVDSSSHAFVAGATQSTNFPVTNAVPGFNKITGKLDINVGRYPLDAFVTELSPDGSSLVYSTYLGGRSSDAAFGIALDSADNAYITGFTYSDNFPVFPDPASVLQNHLACTNSFYLNANAFVAEIASGGGALVYSTYLGGTNFDTGRAITVDANNYVYIAGYTASTNFPVINEPTNQFPNFPAISHLNGATNSPGRLPFDAFVTKFPPLGTHPSSLSSLVYSTFLGGTNADQANGIAADSDGNAYVTGWTTSTNFPVVFSSLINTNPAGLYSFLTTNGSASSGVTNVFLTKIAPQGSNILNSIVFGGSRMDIGYGVAIDSAGDAFVVGTASSTNFPTVNTFASLSHTNNAGLDVFVTGISADWTSTYYSVLLGGKKDDQGYGIALDSATNAYITGATISTNFPTANTGRFSFTFTNDINLTNITFTTNVVGGTNVITTNTVITPTNVVVNGFINGTNFINGSKFVGTNDAFLAEILFTTPSPTNITLVPTTETVGAGGTATFTLTVTGISTPVLYQWQREIFTNQIITNIIAGVSTNKVTNSVPSGVFTNLPNSGRFSGATSNILTITNCAATDSSSNYQAVITWGDAPYITNAVLDVEQGPVIAVPPEDQTNFFGGTATFTVTAFGQSPLHYQWLFDGTNLVNSTGHVSGATNNTLTITGLTTNNMGTFDVVITNAFGSTNASATLTMLTTSPTNITLVPTNDIVGVGGTARFTLTVAGTSTPVFYQWQREIFTNQIITNIIAGISTNKVTNSLPSGVFTNIQNAGRFRGATSNVLTITNVITTDSSSNYQAVITWGEAPYITNATLQVEQGPVIAVPPVDQTNAVGSPATFTVTAFGQPPLHYQWLFDGTNLVNSTGHVSGATSNVLNITSLTTNNEGTFEVVITNLFGATNASAMLVLIKAPIIVSPPRSQTVGLGAPVNFGVNAIGASPLRYSWALNGTNLVNGGIVSGATNNVLSLGGVNINNSGTIVVTVTNDFGMTNASATLTVLTAPILSISKANGFATNGVLSFDVVGGTNGGLYNLLFTNNLLAPVSTWPRVGPAQFGSQGQLSFTLLMDTNYPYQFYILQQTNQ